MKRILLKITLIAGFIVFALFHYNMFAERDFQKFNFQNPSQSIQAWSSVTKITYYENPFSSGSYFVVLHADQKYVGTASAQEINLLKTITYITGGIYEESKMPLWVMILIPIAIAVIPFGKRSPGKVSTSQVGQSRRQSVQTDNPFAEASDKRKTYQNPFAEALEQRNSPQNFCPNCGNKVDTRFCPGCGTEISGK